MLRKSAVAVLLMLLVSTYGCTRVQRGMVLGAAVGGGIGALTNLSSNEECWENAGIGAVAGGILGALIADATEERHEMEECHEPGPKPIAKITLSNDVLFHPGSAKLTDKGKELLDQVGATIKAQYSDKAIHVEGNTDSDPIVHSGWRSNWELGAARALAVLHYLEDVQNIQGSSLSATTFACHRPAASNDTAEGKSANRRTDVVVYMMEY